MTIFPHLAITQDEDFLGLFTIVYKYKYGVGTLMAFSKKTMDASPFYRLSMFYRTNNCLNLRKLRKLKLRFVFLSVVVHTRKKTRCDPLVLVPL